MYDFIDDFANFFYSAGNMNMSFFRIFACLLVFGFVSEIIYSIKTLSRW